MDDDDSAPIDPAILERISNHGLEGVLVVAAIVGLAVAAWVWFGQRRTVQASRADVAGFLPRRRRRRRSRRD